MDNELNRQTQREKNLWVNILRRVLGVKLCLASLNLAIREHHKKVGEGIAQGGNFLHAVSMLSGFGTITNDAISLPKHATR